MVGEVWVVSSLCAAWKFAKKDMLIKFTHLKSNNEFAN